AQHARQDAFAGVAWHDDGPMVAFTEDCRARIEANAAGLLFRTVARKTFCRQDGTNLGFEELDLLRRHGWLLWILGLSQGRNHQETQYCRQKKVFHGRISAIVYGREKDQSTQQADSAHEPATKATSFLVRNSLVFIAGSCDYFRSWSNIIPVC